MKIISTEDLCFYTIFALLIFGTTFACVVFGGLGIYNAIAQHRNTKGTK